jgi:hypothetical protein
MYNSLFFFTAFAATLSPGSDLIDLSISSDFLKFIIVTELSL